VSGTVSGALLNSNKTVTNLSELKLTDYEIKLHADNSKAVDIS